MGDGLESSAAESSAAGILGADSLGDTMMADMMLRPFRRQRMDADLKLASYTALATPDAMRAASWINQVERWFAELTRKQLRRGIHTSVKQLEADIRSFINRHNQNPRPFNGQNPPTKSSLQLSASATKRSRHYVANFRFA
jgi:hypothetical protein